MRFLGARRGWVFGGHGERAVIDLVDGDKWIYGYFTNDSFAMDPRVQLRSTLNGRLQISGRSKEWYAVLAESSK
jgi:hypothetical protein